MPDKRNLSPLTTSTTPYNATDYMLATPSAATLKPGTDGYALGYAFPGGPRLGEYGVDLTRLEQIPLYSGAPVPEPEPRMTPPPTSYTLGAPGTPIFSGFVQDLGEYNPKFEGRNSIPIYERMRRSDADVHAAMLACKLPIRSAEKQIIPGSGPNSPNHALAKDIADFVRENLFGGLETISNAGVSHSQPFEEVESNGLLALDFGCGGHEDIWHIDGDKVRLRRLAPRLPISFYRFWTDEDGEVLNAIEQYGYRKNEYVNVLIPAEKFCLFTHQKEGANFWGISALRSAYQHWYIKEALYRIDSIALERGSMGVPTFGMPQGSKVEDKQAALAWGQNLVTHEQSCVVKPYGWEFSIEGIKGRLRDPFNSIRHQSEMIVKSVLGMFLGMGSSQQGARAFGSSMLDFFMLGLEASARNLASNINEQSIKRLVDYNWTAPKGQKLPYPKLEYASIVVLNPIEIAGAIRDLGNSQVDTIQADDELEAYLRRRLGLPMKTQMRTKYLPVNIRLMSAPEAGETIPEIESGADAAVEPTGGAGSAVPSATNKTPAVNRVSGPVSYGGTGAKSEVPQKTSATGSGAVPGLEPMARSQSRIKTAPVSTKVKMSETEDAMAIGGTLYRLLMSDSHGKTVCVDFDGVLATHSNDKGSYGPLIPEGKQLVEDLKRKGYRIVILTARKNLGLVQYALKQYGIPFDQITNHKVPAVAYIDDRAISVNSKKPESFAKAGRNVEKLDKKSL